MKTPNTEADLNYWNDADALLHALYALSREPIPSAREAVVRLLDHDDPDVREEALRVLLTRWKDIAVRHRAFAALASDPFPNVQSAAAFAVAATGTVDTVSTDTQILLEVLHDVDRDLSVRSAAYDALIILHRRGVNSDKWPFPSLNRSFDPSRDVDWAWIRSLEQI